jgi:hypothetical protein
MTSTALQLSHSPARLDLIENQPQRLVRARGALVTAIRGRLWITVDGHAGDILLREGQRWAIPLDGLTLIEALGGPATVRIEGPRNPLGERLSAWRQRAARMLASLAPT